MVLLELVRGQVVEAGVRAHGVVVLAPRLDDDLGFASRTKPLDTQTLVAELAVEPFVGAVLPRHAMIDKRGLDARIGEPLQDGMAYELGTVVRPQVGRRSVYAHQARKHVDDAYRANAPGHVDREAFMRELV